MDQQLSAAAEVAAFDDYFSEFDDRLNDSVEHWRSGTCDLAGFVWRWVLKGYLRRDVDVLASMVTEDFTQRDPLNLGRVVHGPSGFRRTLERTFVAFPDLRFAADGAPYLGVEVDLVIFPWRARGTFSGPLQWGRGGSRSSLAPTGRGFDVTGVDEYLLRGGKVCRARSLYDPIEVMRQLGLLPGAGSVITPA